MTTSTLPLSGKRALVTGAARGIGAAIALKLAEDGADVAITYEKSADKAEALAAQIRALGRKAVAIQADAGSVEGPVRSVADTVAALGGLDILVNNAGVGGDGSLVSDQPLDDIERLLNVNVRGVVLTSQAALAHIPDGGRIISIASCLSDRVPFPGVTVYSATKSALDSFNQGLAREVGARQITVNLVKPGPIDTDMNPADGPFSEAAKSVLALGHYGEPRDIAEAVAFLASPGAKFVTGTSLVVDGGANA